MESSPGVIKWPAHNAVNKSVVDLIPYTKNSRTHSAEQVGQIAKSIETWGFMNPVLIDEHGVIIAGHGRVMAANLLKLREVPCVIATGWTDQQKQAYVIADNKLAMNAGWDMPVLMDELGTLAGEGFDLTLIGFGLGELHSMFGNASEKEEFDGDMSDKFTLMIEYGDEAELQTAYEEAKSKGLKCKLMQ